MSRKSFVLYTEWEDAFDGQPNDIAGELIKAIFDYVRTEEMPQTDNTVVNAMFSIYQTTERSRSQKCRKQKTSSERP